ncbi:MAG: zinc-ribbon domain containing protein [Roseiflexaceae bacterium]|nr:zinc-ribbon domain containing protein [Roseiflexaceae bacterium]
MSYADKTITCRDCGVDFVFTSGEQEFYAQKGFTNEPTRCPSCRQQRKAGGGGRSGGGYSDRDSSYGGGSRGGYSDRDSSYGGGSRDSYSSRGPREMHSAICASCGKEAQVPFVPRGDKPVYCSDCFQQQRQSSGRSNNRW